MKFDKYISYYKRKNFTKKVYKNCDLKTSSRPLRVFKESSTTSLGKWNFWSKLLRYVIAKLSKFIQISMQTPQICRIHIFRRICPKLFNEHGESMMQIKKSRNIHAYVFYQLQVSKQNITTQNSCYSKPHHCSN